MCDDDDDGDDVMQPEGAKWVRQMAVHNADIIAALIYPRLCVDFVDVWCFGSIFGFWMLSLDVGILVWKVWWVCFSFQGCWIIQKAHLSDLSYRNPHVKTQHPKSNGSMQWLSISLVVFRFSNLVFFIFFWIWSLLG